MRVTVCELPHHPAALAPAWEALCAHTHAAQSQWLVLPEFAWVPPLWLHERFDAALWAQAEQFTQAWLARLPELGVETVVGSRPVTRAGQPLNEGFVWTAAQGVQPLRSKFYLPDEPGGWEARWFRRGDAEFAPYQTAGLRWGLSICTELWALENCATYAQAGVQAIVSPRATAAATTDKWLALGQVVAARTGAFSLSSNRVDPDGSCGGVGWVISPDGAVLARTSQAQPFCTVEVDAALADAAKASYPRYVFAEGRAQRVSPTMPASVSP